MESFFWILLCLDWKKHVIYDVGANFLLIETPKLTNGV